MSNFSFMADDYPVDNLTFMDVDDPFANFNASQHHDMGSLSTIGLVFEIVKLLECVCSMGASVFLVYVIVKFDRLRTRTNIFLLHYAISTLVNALFVPFFIVVEFLTDSPEIMCFAYNGNAAICVSVLVFATAINVFWFLQTFKAEWLHKVQHFQLWFIVALYSLCILKFAICVYGCLTDLVFYFNYLLVAVYVVMLLVTLVINAVAYRKGLSDAQRRTKYQSTVATYVVLSYFALFFFSEVEYFLFSELSGSIADYGPMILFMLSELLAYSGPIVVVFLLGRGSKHFKAAFNRVFKKSVRSYDDEISEDFEGDRGETAANSNRAAVTNGIVEESLGSVTL